MIFVVSAMMQERCLCDMNANLRVQKLTDMLQERAMTFEVGALMRRSDTYLDKVTSMGSGDFRGKMTLNIDMCRTSLAQTQVCALSSLLSPFFRFPSSVPLLLSFFIHANTQESVGLIIRSALDFLTRESLDSSS